MVLLKKDLLPGLGEERLMNISLVAPSFTGSTGFHGIFPVTLQREFDCSLDKDLALGPYDLHPRGWVLVTLGQAHMQAFAGTS